MVYEQLKECNSIDSANLAISEGFELVQVVVMTNGWGTMGEPISSVTSEPLYIMGRTTTARVLYEKKISK